MLVMVGEGIVLGLSVFLFAWSLYHVVLLVHGLRQPRPGTFDPGGLRNPVDLLPVTIVIPAKQASPVVEGAIRQAVRLRYPSELKQIIVVEDGSTDDTREKIEKVTIDHHEVHFIKRPVTSGKPAALNAAFPHIRGEWVLFMDVDSRVSDEFLLRAAKFFHDRPDVDAAQAILRSIDDNPSLISALDRYENHLLYAGVTRSRDRLGLFVPLGGTGMFIRRKVLEEVGPWDERSLAEDLDYAVRLWKGGKRIAVLPADVYIQSPDNVRNFVRQRRRWWGGTLQVFARGRFMGGGKLGPKRRFDMTLAVAAPLVMLLGNGVIFGSLAAFLVGQQIAAGLTYLLWAVLASHLILIATALAWAFRQRKWRPLKLIPGLYVDWALQVAILFPLVVEMAFGRRIPWVTTEKRKVDWSPNA